MPSGVPAGIEWELRRMAELSTLADGEILCEIEEAVLDGKRGVLVVTDLRVLFVRTTVILRRTKVVSIPLGDVQGVEAFEDPVWESRWGALNVAVRSSERPDLEFGAIPGGRARAEEIERTIERQRELVERP